MKKVRELDVTLTHSIFEELLTAAQPVVIRGLVKDWPLVKAHAKSPQAFIDYLQQFNAEINVNVFFIIMN
jgi:hypothetical protein